MDMSIWTGLFSDCAEYGCEHTAALPDYYPPVMRVVRACARASVISCGINGGTLSASVRADFTLMYQTEDERGLCSFTSHADFTQTFALPEGCTGNPLCRCESVSVSCRLMGARRVCFKGVFAVHAGINGERRLSLAESGEGEMLYLRRDCTVSAGAGSAVKQVHLSERGECDTLPAAPLYTDAACILTELKSAGGKTVVKGEVRVRTLFVTRADEIGFVAFVFPFSQLMDIPLPEPGNTRVDFAVGTIECELSESLDGNRGRFDYEIDIVLRAEATRTGVCSLILDAFSPRCELEQRREQVLLETPCGSHSGSVSLRAAVDAPAGVMPVDVSACVTRCEAVVGEKTARISGEMRVEALLCEEGGRLSSALRSEAFSFDVALPASSCKRRGRARAAVWSEGLDGEAARLTLRYELELAEVADCEYLTQVRADESRPLAPVSRPAVSVYFADAGESVWDIAKRYLIPPERIRDVNNIEGESVERACRLLLR